MAKDGAETLASVYFGENQYPDEAKREEIANACNTVIQKPGKKLSEFERVTPLKVYNWFANRRKEMKRRANIEAAILESHGIDVQSPGGHSNSDDIEGNDYCEQDENTCHSDHQQDPISLAVEMAAVNHSVLALASQGGSEIKTEAIDDD
ncbi:homeobox-containing protein 1-like [Rhincodon typus]|uniref:homeobox-containing protein 1-like n=1 Tax=Rhincodon typus TaxID=259920 RepID=UPI00202F8EAC|nr:homeobox-containing protein 1-like [Rhincodon typus]